MNYTKIIFSLCSFVALSNVNAASAQVIRFPQTNKPAGTTAVSNKPVVRGVCFFPSVGPFVTLIRNQVMDSLTANGYRNPNANVVMLFPPSNPIELKSSSISGAKGVKASSSKPLEYVLIGGTTAEPVELPCAMEVRVDIQSSGIDSSGKFVFGKATSTVVVQGVFR